jgi:hypothetical protein
MPTHVEVTTALLVIAGATLRVLLVTRVGEGGAGGAVGDAAGVGVGDGVGVGNGVGVGVVDGVGVGDGVVAA